MTEIKYPSFAQSKMIAIDLETYDPELTSKGNGVYRKDGYILGFSLGDDSGFAEYYNVGHPDCSESEKKKNLAYLKAVMALPTPKVGANIQYDADWIEQGYGIPIAGELFDVITAEGLLDENLPSYSLDTIAAKYLGVHKKKAKPEAICEANGWKGDFRKHLYKMNYSDVREYGRADAEYPVRILRIQEKLIASQDLGTVWQLETDMQRILLLMRKTGVRIDSAKRAVESVALRKALDERKAKLEAQYGKFNYNSSKQVAAILDGLGASYATRETTGNPILDSHALKALASDFPVTKQIIELKKIDKILSTFVDGSLKEHVTSDGRIHPTFYATKTEREGGLAGTRSGRLSCASPNLQQIPSFDEKEEDEFKKWYTHICRSLFIPEEDQWWLKIDYSQIEYRFMAHFACNANALDTSADDVRAQYRNNPKTDYHQLIQDLTGLPRKLAKNLNFGVGYGMGKAHMSEFFGWDPEYCDEVLTTYHTRAPFVKATMNAVGAIGRKQGYIRTFLKRRSRLLDPRKSYILFCRLCQGSAADLAKQSIVNIWKAGLLDVLTLHLTVHDEFDFSMPKTKVGIEAGVEAKHLMETALTLSVPVIADAEVSDTNWVDLRGFEKDELLAMLPKRGSK